MEVETLTTMDFEQWQEEWKANGNFKCIDPRREKKKLGTTTNKLKAALIPLR